MALSSGRRAQQGAAPASALDAPEPGPKVPEGFTPIFNGKDLSGWHVSKTNHHGTTPDYHVLHGLIVGTQNPKGQGGILLTDKKYKDVEVYMEIKPDWGCDSGLFLRSNEAGDAYQVTLDYLAGGGMGGIYGEGLKGVQNAGTPSRKSKRGRRCGTASDGTPCARGSPVRCRTSWSGSTISSLRISLTLPTMLPAAPLTE